MKPTGYEEFIDESLDATEDRYTKLKSKLDHELLMIKRERKRRKKIENRNHVIAAAQCGRGLQHTKSRQTRMRSTWQTFEQAN